MTGTTAQETHGYDHDPDREREPGTDPTDPTDPTTGETGPVDTTGDEFDRAPVSDETRLIDASDRPDGFTPRHAATGTHPDEVDQVDEADELDEVDEGDGVATGHVHLPEEQQGTGTVYDHGTPVDDTDLDDDLEPAAVTTDTAETAGATEGPVPGKWWPEGASDEVMGRWREAQIAFVDDPAAAVRDGRAAVEDAVRRLTEALDAEVERVSTAGNGGDTEALRQAMRGYRQVLDRLVTL